MSAKANSPTIRWTTFGGAGVVRIRNLQGLLRYICESGFEHHVAANLSQVVERGARSDHALPGLERAPPCIAIEAIISDHECAGREACAT